MHTSLRSVLAVTLFCGLVSGAATAAAASESRGFEDDFKSYSNLKDVMQHYGVGKFAGQGDASGEVNFASGSKEVQLTASTQRGGQEIGAFTLLMFIRKGDVVRLGAEPNVELTATFSKLDGAPFGDKPISPVNIGLAAPSQGPSITAQVGIVGRHNARKIDLQTLIEIKAEDGQRVTVAEHTLKDTDNPAGKPITLKIEGGRVDLLIGDESIVGGAVPLGVDLSTDALGTSPLQATVQIRKNFGKQSRSATLSHLKLVDQTDQGAVQAMLPTLAVTLSKPPAPNAVLQPQVGEPRELSPHFIGYNGNLTSFHQPWDNKELIETTKSLYAATVRYPAGSIGNVWDWDRGWVFEDLDYSKTIRWVENIRRMDKRYSLDNLAKGYKEASFAPVFMLNPIHHTLDEQVGHLKKIEAMGVPIELVELGTEYYFGRGADAYMNDKWPTAQDYGKDANRWAARMKKEFPGVKVAACGSGGGSSSTSQRRQTWNDNMVPVLDDSIHAITIHTYPGHGLDGMLEGNDMEAALSRFKGRIAPPKLQQAVTAKLKTPEGLAYMMTRPAADWKKILGRTLVPDMPIWLTEFNMDDQIGSVRNTWAHTLFIAATLDVYLTDSRIELVHFHNLYGGDLYPAMWSENGLPDRVEVDGKRPKIQDFDISAGGLAMQLFGHAMKNSTEARRIVFSDSPKVSIGSSQNDEKVTTDLVYGWLFEHGLIMANYSGQPITVQVPGSVKSMETLSAPVTAIVAGRESITTQTQSVSASGQIELPAYGIAVTSWD